MKNDISIVTGASRGIGKAIALKFAYLGHKVMLFGRNKLLLNEVKIEINKNNGVADVFVGDVADEIFVKKSINSIIEKYGKVDHLVNNAGIMILKKFVDSDFSEFQRQIETNLFGVYHFTSAVLPGMIKQKSGSIINISSLAGKNAFVGGTMYGATKHALMGFSKSLMLEVRDFNIRVVTVCPGSVNTDLLLNTSVGWSDKESIIQSEDIAKMVSNIISLPDRALVSEIEIRPTNPK